MLQTTFRSGTDHAQAEVIVGLHGRTPLDYFKLWPDKSYHFSPGRRSVVAYRVACSVAVSLGDPVGPLDELELTIRSFLGLCADNGWNAAFHQVLPDFLPVYRRLGLHVLKIGEEALVDLERFATRTSQQRSFRRPRRRLGAWGYRVTREPGPHSEPALDEVEEVSREWLSVNGPSPSGGSIVATWRGSRSWSRGIRRAGSSRSRTRCPTCGPASPRSTSCGTGAMPPTGSWTISSAS